MDIYHHKNLPDTHKAYFVHVDDHVREFYIDNYRALKSDTKRIYISRTYTSQYVSVGKPGLPTKTLEDIIRDIGPKEEEVEYKYKIGDKVCRKTDTDRTAFITGYLEHTQEGQKRPAYEVTIEKSNQEDVTWYERYIKLVKDSTVRYKYEVGDKVEHRWGTEGTITSRLTTDNGKDPAYRIETEGKHTKWSESRIVGIVVEPEAPETPKKKITIDDLKVGMKIKLLEKSKLPQRKDEPNVSCGYVKEMDLVVGKVVTIKHVDVNFFNIKEETHPSDSWNYSVDMVEAFVVDAKPKTKYDRKKYSLDTDLTKHIKVGDKVYLYSMQELKDSIGMSGNVPKAKLGWDGAGKMIEMAGSVRRVKKVLIDRIKVVDDNGESWNYTSDCFEHYTGKPGTPEDDWGIPDEGSTPDPKEEKTVDFEGWTEPEVVKEVLPTPKEMIDFEVKQECKAMFPLPILLEGPVGTMKSTTCMELAEELGLTFYASVLTDQTSKNEFTGYKNVMNGEMVRTEFRECYEFGGLYVLEELNAATSNLPIIFNTIENGYFVFADKLVKAHPDFRLMATMNTITNAKDFGGRRELDKSVRDRFHKIKMLKVPTERYNKETVKIMEHYNKELSSLGITDLISPRDMRRYEQLIAKGMSEEIAIHKAMIQEKAKLKEDVCIDKLREKFEEWK